MRLRFNDVGKRRAIVGYPASAIRAWTTSIVDHHSPRGPSGPKVSLEDGEFRVRAEQALVTGSFCGDQEVRLLSSAELRGRVFAAAETAHENVRSLASDLDRLSQDEPTPVAGFVREILREKWETPGELSVRGAPTNSDAKLPSTVKFLQEYARIYSDAKRFVDSPDAPSLRELRLELKHAVGIGD
jgi:hypothetical protein